jgi:type VI secretion system protein ImpA
LIDVAALVAEISPESPCGPDLEYDADYAELFRVAAGTPERQKGSEIEPAKDPEWADVRERALALFPKTKDVRVALVLTRALVHTDGIEGLASGLAVMAELLNRYWDQVHPVIEADDPAATARLNALAPLVVGERGDPSALVRDVWSASVAATATGRIAVRDILVAQNKLQVPAGGSKLGVDELKGLLKDAAAKVPLPLEAAQKAAQALESMRGCLYGKVSPTDAPNLQPLTTAVGALVEALAEATGTPAAAAAGDGVAAAEPGAGAAARSNEIRGRDDAVRQLERVCEFMERTEPGNPAPLLIRRAQRLMTKDFLGIIQDLAPGSLSEVQKIAGIEPK